MKGFLCLATSLIALTAAAQAQTIVPGKGVLTDAVGNVWTITTSGSILKGDQYTPGGGGTSALMIVNGTVYGLDANGKGWFTFGTKAQAWKPASPPAGTPVTSAAVSGTTEQATTADASSLPSASVPGTTLAQSGCGTAAKTGTYFGILPLQEGGNGQIIAPDGKVFVPRGVNVMQGQEPSLSALQAHFQGINFVRYANYEFSSPEQLAPWINSLTQAGIVVEIEDHTASDGTVSGGGAGQVFTGQQLQHESDWYAALATYFKYNPYVWFGTNNEPPEAGGSLSQWHQATYQAIRSTGNQTIIMIDPWGAYLVDGLDASAYAGMSNVAWDVHFYGWAADYSSEQGKVKSTLASIVSKVQAITSAGGVKMPVIIGEYGN